MVELVMSVDETDDEGEEIVGESLVLAVIDGGNVTGVMADGVRSLIGSRVAYGGTGEVFTVTLREPWTVAYALTLDNAVFRDARVQKTGPVVATRGGTELLVPDRFTADDGVEDAAFF